MPIHQKVQLQVIYEVRSLLQLLLLFAVVVDVAYVADIAVVVDVVDIVVVDDCVYVVASKLTPVPTIVIVFNYDKVLLLTLMLLPLLLPLELDRA